MTTEQESADDKRNRHIRSFVLRQGKMSEAQKNWVQTLYPKYGLAYQKQVTDFSAAFNRAAPLIVEIGFGMGDATAQIAAARPDDNFLGLEVHTPGVGALLNKIETQGLTNLRVLQHDAVEVLRDMIAPDSLAGLHIFFPDPWPKARHHKRRLIQSPFVQLLASRLQPGGYIHCATDWEHYAEQMLEVLSAEPQLVNIAAGYAPKPAYRPLTKFEQRGLKLGHGVWDVVFTRK
ncbi:MAG: tRNA (guanosine(46)-N7)-methyltransferase TrmB [Burkholderiaceae bacterium]|nr:MAG: tRNA (guanosine(46)-N7)-methyltransferase TrmB [Burkholderiaceae bacterium]